jgi:hypothetical protein
MADLGGPTVSRLLRSPSATSSTRAREREETRARSIRPRRRTCFRGLIAFVHLTLSAAHRVVESGRHDQNSVIRAAGEKPSLDQFGSTYLINAASSTGRCNTFQCIHSTMLPRENQLFGFTWTRPSQGSVPAGLTLAGDYGFCFQC